MSETFAVRLKRLREAAGLTQEGLARQAGLNPWAVAKLEQGQNAAPTWRTVQKLVAALGVSCEAFADAVPSAPTPGRLGRPKKATQTGQETPAARGPTPEPSGPKRPAREQRGGRKGKAKEKS
jgi:transcriptional regulator with XRE-family HTH domain